MPVAYPLHVGAPAPVPAVHAGVPTAVEAPPLPVALFPSTSLSPSVFLTPQG